jgi:hypothetical protein
MEGLPGNSRVSEYSGISPEHLQKLSNSFPVTLFCPFGERSQRKIHGIAGRAMPKTHQYGHE